MLSTPSYFKLKSQLRLAAENHPSTCIEFELRCLKPSLQDGFYRYHTECESDDPQCPLKTRVQDIQCPIHLASTPSFPEF